MEPLENKPCGLRQFTVEDLAPPRAAQLRVRVVPVKLIAYIIASGPCAQLQVADKRYVIRERMQTLEERLDPGRFFRIHRSAIVRLDLVETLLRNPGGDYALLLKGGVKLKVSRNRFEALERRMGVS